MKSEHLNHFISETVLKYLFQIDNTQLNIISCISVKEPVNGNKWENQEI